MSKINEDDERLVVELDVATIAPKLYATGLIVDVLEYGLENLRPEAVTAALAAAIDRVLPGGPRA